MRNFISEDDIELTGDYIYTIIAKMAKTVNKTWNFNDRSSMPEYFSYNNTNKSKENAKNHLSVPIFVFMILYGTTTFTKKLLKNHLLV